MSMEAAGGQGLETPGLGSPHALERRSGARDVIAGYVRTGVLVGGRARGAVVASVLRSSHRGDERRVGERRAIESGERSEAEEAASSSEEASRGAS